MLPDKLKNFLGRVKGDPFASIYMDRGKVQQEETLFQHDVVIEAEHFFSYHISMKKFDTAYFEVEVVEGGEIDILVTNEYNFRRYMRAEEFIYLRGGSILKILKVNNLFVAQDEETYHVILDNTFYPDGGARPNMDLNYGVVRVKLGAKTHVPLLADFGQPRKI